MDNEPTREEIARDQHIGMQHLYGFHCMHSELGVKFVIPQPRNRWEAAWWVFLGVWHDIIVPSFWFALAFTAFKFALFA